MKIKTLIHNITGQSVKDISPIPTGLTNHNYHVTTEFHDYVLRCPKPENKELFDYHHEKEVLDMIKPLDLEPRLVYYDEQSGIKLSDYVYDANTLSPSDYHRAVKLIAKLHNAKIHSGQSFDIQSKYKLYQSDNPIYDLSPYEHYIQEAAELCTDLILCHNDCVEGNFLFTKDKNYLIDFEYASDNDPYFDLLSLITENDITDPHIKQDLINTYFDLVEIDYDEYKLSVFEGAHHTLWCAWACSMYETFNEAIYKEIADLKYKRLTEMKNDTFK